MTHTLPITIYYEDTDAQGVVYYANYLRYFERARTEYLREIGYGQKRLMDKGAIFIVRKISIEFLKPAKLDDQIIIKTKLLKCGKVTFDFSQEVYLKKEEILCQALVRCGCLGTKDFKPVGLPSYLHKGMKSLL